MTPKRKTQVMNKDWALKTKKGGKYGLFLVRE